MDIVFTLMVWLAVVALTAHGLRLAQLRRPDEPPSPPLNLPRAHPVTATSDRVLVGAGSPPTP